MFENHQLPVFQANNWIATIHNYDYLIRYYESKTGAVSVLILYNVNHVKDVQGVKYYARIVSHDFDRSLYVEANTLPTLQTKLENIGITLYKQLPIDGNVRATISNSWLIDTLEYSV